VTPAVLEQIVEITKGKEAPSGDVVWIGAKK
jgi:hypothetical protein